MTNAARNMRLFINSHTFPVPGYVSGPGTIELPLRLDGSTETISLDTQGTNTLILGEHLEQTIASFRLPSFVNRRNKFVLYGSSRDFKRVHRPVWLDLAADAVAEMVGNYAKGEGPLVSQLTPYNLVRELETAWSRREFYLGSLLYGGNHAEPVNTFDPASFTIYGPPVEMNITGLLWFLDTMSTIDTHVNRGLRPHYVVKDSDTGPLAEAPAIALVKNDEGNVILQEPIPPEAPDVRANIAQARQDNARFLAMYTFAEFNITAQDVFAMFRDGYCPQRTAKKFLMEKRSSDEHDAARVAHLINIVMEDIAANPEVSTSPTS